MPERFTEFLDCLAPYGLTYQGGFYPDCEESLSSYAGFSVQTLVLVGHGGSSLWPAFSRWYAEHQEVEDPLDTWSETVLNDIADRCGAVALFPFHGPPYWPFVRWAEQVGQSASAIGLLMHPVFGLWHAYRGALVFPDQIPLPAVDSTPSACLSCLDKPCLSACPVAAIGQGRYALSECVQYLHQSPDNLCVQTGCQARRACPVGLDYRYEQAHAEFHMRSFLNRQLKRLEE